MSTARAVPGLPGHRSPSPGRGVGGRTRTREGLFPLQALPLGTGYFSEQHCAEGLSHHVLWEWLELHVPPDVGGKAPASPGACCATWTAHIFDSPN